MPQIEEVVSPTVSSPKNPRVAENSEDRLLLWNLDDNQPILSQSNLAGLDTALSPESQQAPSDTSTQTAFSPDCYSSNRFEEELFDFESQVAAVTKIFI